MTPAQQFALSASLTAEGWVFTLPPQVRPFRVEGVFFRYQWGAGNIPDRDNFCRFRFGGSTLIWSMGQGSRSSPAIRETINYFRGAEFEELTSDNVNAHGYTTVFPLPDLILGPEATVDFGVFVTGYALDTASDGSVMISYPEQPAAPWWLGRRKKV